MAIALAKVLKDHDREKTIHVYRGLGEDHPKPIGQTLLRAKDFHEIHLLIEQIYMDMVIEKSFRPAEMWTSSEPNSNVEIVSCQTPLPITTIGILRITIRSKHRLASTRCSHICPVTMVSI